MQKFYFSLHISSEEYLKLYQGVAKNVSAFAHDGRRVSFPATILRQFVTAAGVSGSFVVTADENNKFLSVERLAD